MSVVVAVEIAVFFFPAAVTAKVEPISTYDA
jgi:hypothetical protein